MIEYQLLVLQGVDSKIIDSQLRIHHALHRFILGGLNCIDMYSQIVSPILGQDQDNYSGPKPSALQEAGQMI